MFTMWIQSTDRRYIKIHYCEDRTPKHWTIELDIELHHNCEKCQEDFKGQDHLEQQNHFEQN